MPNFWTKATQFFDETINGPRTKDEEFTTKISKLKQIEKGMHSINDLIKDFSKNTNQFKIFITKLSESINFIILDDSTVSVTNEILKKYQTMMDHYNNFVMEIGAIDSYVNSWKEEIKNIHQKIEKREDKRKIFDHYDEKLEKIKKSSKKDYSYLQRNQDKFNKAKNDFNAVSQDANQLIDTFFNNRFNIFKPVLSQFFTAEKKFYTNIYNVISNQKDINITLGNRVSSYNEQPKNFFNDDWFFGNNNNQQQKIKDQHVNHSEQLIGIIEGVPGNRNRSHTNYQKNSQQNRPFKTFDFMNENNQNNQNNPLLFQENVYQRNNEDIKNQGCPPGMGYQNYKDSVMSQYMTQDVNRNRKTNGKGGCLLDDDSFE